MKIIDKLKNMGLPELLALADFAEEISAKKYLDISYILEIILISLWARPGFHWLFPLKGRSDNTKLPSNE